MFDFLLLKRLGVTCHYASNLSKNCTIVSVRSCMISLIMLGSTGRSPT
jgi:hypothetical protein